MHPAATRRELDKAAWEVGRYEAVRVWIIDAAVAEGATIGRQVKQLRKDVGNAAARTYSMLKPFSKERVGPNGFPRKRGCRVPFLQEG